MNVILTYSGGIDSTVLLYQLLGDGAHVRCLSFDYGQRHRVEIQHAADICARLGVENRIADFKPLAFALNGSSQTSPDIDVPEGHYTDASMARTVVPNRNMLMLATATAWALATDASAVAYAAHAGDHAIYPDCRPEFAASMASAMALAGSTAIALVRPLIEMTKSEIVALGSRLGVPFERTWSCYKGLDKHCGKCGTCVERREAFADSHVPDPTEYA